MSGEILPIPNVDLSVRVATLADLPFLDSLQKQFGRALGYFPTKQFEGYIEMGGVLVAEADATIVGYIISRDRYLKRDELGVIYQLCVAPGDQRKLVGASLVKAAFDRSAYGCRLYCCWCAQDLDANYFWESLGFVPIAFRGGSAKKSRVHIFWQRRIREGDTQTPYWFPAKTDNGAMREDRLVLPIPPGLHWRDEMPVLSVVEEPVLIAKESLVIGHSSLAKDKGQRTKDNGLIPGTKCGPHAPTPRPRAGARFGPPSATLSVAPTVVEKPKREKKPKVKADPKLIAAARELRDRWLEHVNAGEMLLEGAGKYDVARQRHLSATATPSERTIPLLPAA